jgi:uncharacterized protein with GYD domain
MPKYLWKASYSPEGVKGVASEGGTGRLEAVRTAVESVGGTLECFYFGFGEADAYVIADLPDNEAATAVALTVNSTGRAYVQTVVLMTPDEVDAAAKREVNFRPAGG